jgi:hypothetical protein
MKQEVDVYKGRLWDRCMRFLNAYKAAPRHARKGLKITGKMLQGSLP